VLHSQVGTEPRQVVDYAEEKFRESEEYELVFAVFDRDDHTTYVNALDRAAQLSGTLVNDEKRTVPFAAVPSVPCFEFWLLLHFDDVQAFFRREEIFKRLKKHRKHLAKAAGVVAADQAARGCGWARAGCQFQGSRSAMRFAG
jgi:RloB-like protein